jgi:large subunit ribosomal protein L7/L12
MSDSAVLEQDLKDIGDKIANLTLKQAKALSDYLESAHGIKPAAGAKTEFDVVMSAHGDKKLEVVKVVRALTGMDLMGAKKLVDNPPATIKQGVSEDEAKKLKAELEAAGATVELK